MLSSAYRLPCAPGQAPRAAVCIPFKQSYSRSRSGPHPPDHPTTHPNTHTLHHPTLQHLTLPPRRSGFDGRWHPRYLLSQVQGAVRGVLGRATRGAVRPRVTSPLYESPDMRYSRVRVRACARMCICARTVARLVLHLFPPCR